MGKGGSDGKLIDTKPPRAAGRLAAKSGRLLSNTGLLGVKEAEQG